MSYTLSPYVQCKIDRGAAWVLFASIILFFISGFGMTHGIIDYTFAAFLHNRVLPTVAILSLAIHTLYAIRLSFIRWRIWNPKTKMLLIGSYLIAILGCISIQMNLSTTTPARQSITTTPSASPTTQETTSEKTFTVSELAKYNGKNGSPAYVAVDGIVYDLSTVFKNGMHFGHSAGQDLTNAFFMKHVKSQITKYPIVGTLVKE